jgi:transposase
MTTRTSYDSDVSDAEWAIVAPYLRLMTEDAPQRIYALREVFNALRWQVRAGAPWRLLPHDLPPWYAVYQQAQRWFRAGVFADLAADLRRLLRGALDRPEEPSAAIFDGRVLQSSPESGDRAGYDGGKRRKGSKVHMAVDTLGHLLTLLVSAANEQERAYVGELAAAVQDVTDGSVDRAFVDQGYSGPDAAAAAAAQGITLEVVERPAGTQGFVLQPRRWVVERSFAWLARFRRLARDYERLPETLVGLHFVAFAILLLKRVVQLAPQSA